MNKIATTILLAILILNNFDLFPQSKHDKSVNQFISDQNIALTKQDSILASKVPSLNVPEFYKSKNGRDLPFSLNNAELPYFRPIFSQETFANCGQSAAIGYNFTYEVNRARGLSADDEANQYTPQFTWNFMNGGEGWYGVSYFHSFEILKNIGNPSVLDYGGMYYGGDKRWMSGYNAYYNSAHNRIQEVYSINVSTSEGLTSLKYWLYDHLDGSETGGVACFYAGSPWNYTNIPNDSPEAGKFVITEWTYPATHAMTIVGYNDSVRFDYNKDGKYTNHIDINGDGNVDMKDWEIGALLFANSYGNQWADSGFCYMMYNSLAHKYVDGGIWNQTVNVIDVNPTYTPSVGIRLKIKHNSRNKLKIVAGISADTTLNYPSRIFDLPIVNFQGGDNIMQGIDTINEGDEMGLEFDITHLLGELENDNFARFFIEIIEKDPGNIGNGEILEFSVIDYSDHSETSYLNCPKMIENNRGTMLSIVKEVNSQNIEIITEEIPVVQVDIPFYFQFEADGGQRPYNWSLVKEYKIQSLVSEYPIIPGEVIHFSNDDNDFVSVEIPFSFPFYGNNYSQLNIHIDGFVSFDEGNLPFPYFIGESTMLIDNRIIAPLMSDLKINTSIGEEVTVESTEEYIMIRWNVSHGLVLDDKSYVFSLKLMPSGEIITYYNNISISDGIMWTTGISDGDKENYSINYISKFASHLSGVGYTYLPLTEIYSGLSLSTNGELEGLMMDDTIRQICIKVMDARNISKTKCFQLSTGLLLSYDVYSGNDDLLDFGEVASLNASIKNISNETIEGVNLLHDLNDEFITIISEKSDIGDLLPGETKVLDSAIVFKIDSHVSDQHFFDLHNSLYNISSHWQKISNFKLNAPVLNISDISSNGNKWIEPGLVNQVQLQLANEGHSTIHEIEARLIIESEDIEIVGEAYIMIDQILPNEQTTLMYQIRANPLVTSGTKAPCRLEYYNDDEWISTNDFDLQIGKISVLLIDLDPNHTSIDEFRNDLEELSLNYEVSSGVPSTLQDYKSVFVLLGSLFSYHILSQDEGTRLSEYLENNGNLYMEGRSTWMQQQTPVHTMFDVEPVSDGSYFPVDTIYTIQKDSINQKSLIFTNEQPYSNHYFLSKEGALPFLNFKKMDSACVVTNKTDTYHTIASILEYGSLAEIDTSFTKVDYLNQIADFFELYQTTTGINEHSVIEGDYSTIKVYPNPFRDYVNIQINQSGFIKVKIFNSSGDLIYMEHLNTKASKTNVREVIWDGRDLNKRDVASGIYFIRIQTNNSYTSAKIIKW